MGRKGGAHLPREGMHAMRPRQDHPPTGGV